ncbi:hypothetical protein E2542_SST16330 [Spatholobus suberectus]|nr:hypothetical protein E2542_SST16330 [Spatholobus suberectus]
MAPHGSPLSLRKSAPVRKLRSGSHTRIEIAEQTKIRLCCDEQNSLALCSPLHLKLPSPSRVVGDGRVFSFVVRMQKNLSSFVWCSLFTHPLFLACDVPLLGT